MTPTVSVHIRIFVTSAIGDVCSETQLTGIFTEFQCIAGYGSRDHRNVFIGLRDGSSQMTHCRLCLAHVAATTEINKKLYS